MPSLLHVGSDGLLPASFSPLPMLIEPAPTGPGTHCLPPVGELYVPVVYVTRKSDDWGLGVLQVDKTSHEA